MTVLDRFHPLIREWFLRHHAAPTDIQEKAWPEIAKGRHVLVTAPTGSGKTLTAFLWAVNRFATKDLTPGRTRVLYVSPLKALNNDIRRNLLEPLSQIREGFEERGLDFPQIRVLTRSGDTPQEDRRKMLRHPPEILITTPESLNLMLSSKSGRGLLHDLCVVILDEIHAVAGSKRGVHLISAVDRLVRLSGEFQRICLSATVKNKETIAGFVAGFQMKGRAEAAQYAPRKVQIIHSAAPKTYQVRVKYPKKDEARVDDEVWDLLAGELKEALEKNRSTLFFTNGRRLCEKMTYKLNRLYGQPVVYSHHGSLSKQLRHNVEQNLKSGDLKAIVATSSLEMGIDIGSLDEVVMIQSPFSISSAVQRIGRSGHKVGLPSRGTFFCAHAQDLIATAVIARAVSDHDIEEIIPIDCPLDVLAQIVISETGMETWDMDELYAHIKTSSPYHGLSRKQYDLVINMLAGKYADTRIRELKPRVSVDRLDNTIQAKKGALLSLYMSGGTIPDRGYFQLRHQESRARIGELDEEYVWEAKIGQVTTIGTQNWKITGITHNDVFAVPVGNSRMDAPFWIAEGLNRDFHLSERMLDFLESANDNLKDKNWPDVLQKKYFLDENAGDELIRFLKRQKEVTDCDLPHRHHMVFEYVRSGPDGGSPGSMLVIHTLWGGRLNRPWAMAIEAAWQEKYKEVPEIFPGNDAIVIQLPHRIEPEELLSLVPADRMENLLRQQLEKSGFFSARFRECAGRALLVIRNKINQRMPLWMTRLKSKKLLENILQYEDFPILLETWRTCLKDEFDLEQLTTMLQAVETGRILWSKSFTSRPSPFAAGMAWNQINQYMYKEDEGASSSSQLGSDLVRDLVFSSDLRPAVSAKIVEAFEQKARRLAKGYAPADARDLADWVKERVVILWDEWQILLSNIKKESRSDFEHITESILSKVAVLSIRHMDQHLVVSFETAGILKESWYKENPAVSVRDLNGMIVGDQMLYDTGQETMPETALALLGQWLSFYGPLSQFTIIKRLGLPQDQAAQMLDDLIETRQVISGRLVQDGPEDDICDAQNFEILLRMSRAQAVPKFEALEPGALAFFLARQQGITKKGDSVDDLFERLEQLTCLHLPANLWETHVLPSRMAPYFPSFLDTILQEGGIQWIGSDGKKLCFCFSQDLDLLAADTDRDTKADDKNEDQEIGLDTLGQVFQAPGVRFDFSQLMGLTGLSSAGLSQKLWDLVWQSRLSNETFSSVRKGIETGYKAPSEKQAVPSTGFGRRRRPGKSGFSRWKGSLPFSGHWYAPDLPGPPDDLLEKEELKKDRVRLLLDRYGILFRELLHRETEPFRWRDLFRTLRLMELSGEILSGYFFKEIPGPQFASHKAFRKLTAGPAKDIVYSMNAADPASVCGISIKYFRQNFPKRLVGTTLVFKGKKLVLESRNNGKVMHFHAAPDDENIVEYISQLSQLLNRSFNPQKKITIETVNDETASKSPYIQVFETVFNVLKEYRSVTLYRKEDSFF